jgi:hypothetical protein
MAPWERAVFTLVHEVEALHCLAVLYNVLRIIAVMGQVLCKNNEQRLDLPSVMNRRSWKQP